MTVLLKRTNFSLFCRTPVAEVEERVAQYHDRAWQKILFAVMPDRSLKPHNVFQCELVIPGTNFVTSAKTAYSPSKADENPFIHSLIVGFFSTPDSEPVLRQCHETSLSFT